MGKSSNSKLFWVKTNIFFAFFFFFFTGTNGSKVVVDKIADTLMQIKAVEANYIKNLCILHHALIMKKRPVLLKIIIDEALKINKFY